VAQDQQRDKSEDRFWCKIFQTKHDIVGALCDEELLEKSFQYRGAEIKVSKHFYGGGVVDETAATKIMSKVTIGNVIGEKIINLAKEKGFITDENIISIDGIPHAQFVKI
jgi:hypothetical protein